YFPGEPCGFRATPGVTQELVNVEQTRPREDTLIAHVLIFSKEIVKQFGFESVARSKITVPALAGDRSMQAAIPDGSRLAQAGSGGDDRKTALRLGRALVEHHEVLRGERRDSIGVGLEVVDEEHGLDAQPVRHSTGVHHPGQVGRYRAPVLDRSGNTETSAVDFNPAFSDKLGDNLFQAGVPLAGIVLLEGA